jgi:hypothetical protein
MKRNQQKLGGNAFVMCRLVHYVGENGVQLPFLLCDCVLNKEKGNHTASGVIFDSTPCTYKLNVPFDARRRPGTWHFPSFGRMAKKKGPEVGKPLVDPAKIALKQAGWAGEKGGPQMPVYERT